MGEQQVGAIEAALGVGLVQGLEGRLDSEHLGHGVNHHTRELHPLVGEAMGEVHAVEGVGQSRVRTPGSRQSGGVVVAADHHGGHTLVADPGQPPLGDAERPVRRPRMVEHVAQPDDQLGILGQGSVDGRLESELEVPLALVDPLGRGHRVVRASQVRITEGSHPHRAQSTSAATLAAAERRGAGAGSQARTASS